MNLIKNHSFAFTVLLIIIVKYKELVWLLMCFYTSYSPLLHTLVPRFLHILQCTSINVKNRKATDLWNIKPVGLRKHYSGIPIMFIYWRNSEKKKWGDCALQISGLICLSIERDLSALGCFTARVAVHLNCSTFWWNWPPSFFLKMTAYDNVLLLKCLSTHRDSKSVSAFCFFSLSTKCIAYSHRICKAVSF